MEMKKFFSTLFDDPGNKVVMVNNKKEKIKDSPAGFSWTTLIFGFWPALLRGDFLGALVIMVINAGTNSSPVLYVLSSTLIAIFYNYVYINRKINKGYDVPTDNDKELLKEHGYNINADASYERGDNN
ncbi:hypothetical protein 8014-B2_0091 [Lactobacillus phage ATCC 8014-B2]|uniref:DUF2628 domain-containing protein n=1 Tax=Lactobacillus phage ATCC 8014-B2 TaxID=1225795 RepID=K4I0J4_9CAUD|nr:hypothetical protein HOQ89_gp055 [Lactobacillus phage ATCC 8014-B2]AFU63158.1 hypothetical protein 8014-B2_0091 [Lactobacillus phage ATCC 8014-B2]